MSDQGPVPPAPQQPDPAPRPDGGGSPFAPPDAQPTPPVPAPSAPVPGPPPAPGATQPYPVQGQPPAPYAAQPYPGQAPQGQAYPSGQPTGAPGQVPDGAQPWDPNTAPPAPPARSRKRLVGGIVGGAVGLGLIGGGAVFAYSLLDGSGAQPEAALPADTLAYARIDLDPSAAQKINLLRLASSLPELDAEWGLGEDSDLRELFIDAVGDGECDFATDVEPWLGQRAAIAALPGSGEDEPVVPVGLVQVTDEDAARAALTGGLCGAEPVAGDEIAFAHGYAVLSPDGTAADVVTAAEEASLADDERFRADLDALGDPGLLSFWADTQGFVELLTELDPTFDAEDPAVLAQLESTGTVVGALRAGSDHVELAVLSEFTDGELLAAYGDSVALVEALPETTLVAGAGAVAPGGIDAIWDYLHTVFDAYAQSGLSLTDGLYGDPYGDPYGDSWDDAWLEDPFGEDPFAEDPFGNTGSDDWLDDTSTGGGLGDMPVFDGTDLQGYCEESADWFLDESYADFDDDFKDAFRESFLESCLGEASLSSHQYGSSTGSTDLSAGTGTEIAQSSLPAAPLAAANELDELVETLAQELDIHLPEDLATLLGEQFVLALDARGLEDLEAVASPGDVRFGGRTLGDADALADLVGRVDALLTQAGVGPLPSQPTDDGLVVASSEEYAQELAEAGGLGRTAGFRAVVPGTDVASLLYVDLDGVEEIARANGADDEVLSYLAPLQAFGVTYDVEDTRVSMSMRLSFG